MMPCLVVLGFGLPKIRSEPLLVMDGDIDWSGMLSKSLWLYGGFTNLGVLAGEAITPRRSYLIAVAVLVPLKILLRFVPFLIAFSIESADGEHRQFESTGFFNVVSGEVAGQWLRTWYFAGSIVCFIGFYNAMAMAAERTAFYFCEERFAGTLNRLQDGGFMLRFLFKMPTNGGIRKIYILLVAGLELVLVQVMEPSILIELEMLIYAMSAALFFYAFVYLRFQRIAKFQGTGRYRTSEKATLINPEPNAVSLDAEGQTRNEEVFNIPGGKWAAVLAVVFPVLAFVTNTVISLTDAGETFFPYFKLFCFGVLVFVGVAAQFMHWACVGRHNTTRYSAFGTSTEL